MHWSNASLICMRPSVLSPAPEKGSKKKKSFSVARTHTLSSICLIFEVSCVDLVYGPSFYVALSEVLLFYFRVLHHFYISVRKFVFSLLVCIAKSVCICVCMYACMCVFVCGTHTYPSPSSEITSMCFYACLL